MTKTEWLKVALSMQQLNNLLEERAANVKDKVVELQNYFIDNTMDVKFFGDVNEVERRFTEILEILG